MSASPASHCKVECSAAVLVADIDVYTFTHKFFDLCDITILCPAAQSVDDAQGAACQAQALLV